MINIRLNKKNHKKKKPTCGYREIWIFQEESERASNPVVEAQLCGFSLLPCSRDKYTLIWHSMAWRQGRFQNETVGHLHNRVILLLGPESLRVLLSCAN